MARSRGSFSSDSSQRGSFSRKYKTLVFEYFDTYFMRAALLGLFALLVVFAARKAHSAEYSFVSAHDEFTVDIAKDGTVTYKDQEVHAEPFAAVPTLFKVEFAEACESDLGKPDVTITRYSSGVTSAVQSNVATSRQTDVATSRPSQKRVVYAKHKVISDGVNCADIKGKGIYEIPLHKNWFAGPGSLDINLGEVFTIVKDDKTVISFRRENERWQNADARFFTNWTLFEKLQRASAQVVIEQRLNLASLAEYVQEPQSFEIQQGKRTYKFIRLEDKRWAIQFPYSGWLAVTQSFAFIDSMNLDIWQSPASGVLSLIANPTGKRAERIKAIRHLDASWGTDAQRVFAAIMTSKTDDFEVKREIATVLRARPTDENFRILVEALRLAEDPRLKNHLSKVLRVRNPRGPIIEEDDDDQIVATKTRSWAMWGELLK